MSFQDLNGSGRIYNIDVYIKFKNEENHGNVANSDACLVSNTSQLLDQDLEESNSGGLV